MTAGWVTLIALVMTGSQDASDAKCKNRKSGTLPLLS